MNKKKTNASSLPPNIANLLVYMVSTATLTKYKVKYEANGNKDDKMIAF